MNTFAKKRVHLAVAAALVGLGSSATTSQATAQETKRTNTGQALIFPYYTVHNGWQTNFKAINTSDNTLAVKVRFHESENSRDVLDFNVIMSPYDVWAGYIVDSLDGPQFFTTDETCTSPQTQDLNGAHMSDVAYTGQFDDTGSQELDRMREGYLEMLVMGVAPEGWEDEEDRNGDPVYPTAYYAKHVDGVPRDCGKVDQSFLAESSVWGSGDNPLVISQGDDVNCTAVGGDQNESPGAADGSGAPEAACSFVSPRGLNPLKGNLTWLHAVTGVGAGTEAIAVRDWNTALTTDPSGNFVTAQVFPWFLEPTFASGDGLWTVTGVENFESVISYVATLNEWSDNPSNGAATDWVVNFPTKGYHVDWFNEQIQAALSKYRNGQPNGELADVVSADGSHDVQEVEDCNDDRTACEPIDEVPLPPIDVTPFEELFGVDGDGDSTVQVQYTLYDSAEGSIGIGSTVISPAPPGQIESLRWEANVLQFGTEPVVDSNKPVLVDASVQLDGAVSGWAHVEFKNAALPVVAFTIKERDRGEPGTAYGQAMDNGYEE
jgi:hypothetical protein